MARFRRRRIRTVRDVLDALGTSPEEIDDAERAGTAELLALDTLVLPEQGKLTLDELAARVGTDPELVRMFWRTLGFVEPPENEPFFTKRDVSILKALESATNDGLVEPEVGLQVARVLGQSMAQLAAAVVDTDPSTDTDSALDDNESLALRVGELLPFMTEVIDYSFRRHLRAAARRKIDVASAVGGPGQVIGFADLVRFTELSLQLDDDELATVVGRFDELVHRVVIEHQGRIVKMIGDAAMFTVIDPVQGALIALDLAQEVQRDDSFGGLRVGLASGPILARDGDLYGPVVNLASRLVTIGRSGAVNVSQDVREALSGDRRFALRSLGEKSLRHIGITRVYRLRPGPLWGMEPEPDPEPPEDSVPGRDS